MTDTVFTEPVLDVRGLPCAMRRAMIFDTFDGLEAGQSLQVVNDHNPQGLRGHFDDRVAGAYGWEPLELGPEVWRIRVVRT